MEIQTRKFCNNDEQTIRFVFYSLYPSCHQNEWMHGNDHMIKKCLFKNFLIYILLTNKNFVFLF